MRDLLKSPHPEHIAIALDWTINGGRSIIPVRGADLFATAKICNGPRLKAYAAAVETLIEASKQLIQDLEDANETKNDDGTEHSDVAAVREALKAFGVDA